MTLRSSFCAFWHRPSDEGPASYNSPGEPRPLSDFVQWLVEVGEGHQMTSTNLWALYNEFALFTETSTMKKQQFHRRLRAAGIRRQRLSTGRRIWVYRVSADKRSLRLVA